MKRDGVDLLPINRTSHISKKSNVGVTTEINALASDDPFYTFTRLHANRLSI